MNKVITAISLLAALATVSPDVNAETIERSLAVGATPDVHVINAVGDIEVRGGDGDNITISADLGDSAQRLDVTERGDRVTIEVIYEKGGSSKGKWRDDGTRLVITLPAEASLEVEATSADIDVNGVRGELDLSSVSGDVDAQVFNGNVEARSTSGDVELEGNGQPGDARVGSTSGDVMITGIAGSLRARSTSGDIEVTDSQLSKATLSVVSGDIELENATTAESDIDVEAVNGDIDVVLARDFSGRVDITTLTGSINNCFGPKPQRTSRYGPGRVLSFDQGEGRGSLDIETVNGDISICKR